MNLFAVALLSLYHAVAAPIIKPDVCKVVVKVTNIRSNAGDIKLGVYPNQQTYEDDKPILKKFISKANIKDGVVQGEVYLSPGTYGIALIDDENNNGKIDYGFILPNEGFGFSNYYFEGLSLSKPALKKFAFTVSTGQTINVTVKVRYM